MKATEYFASPSVTALAGRMGIDLADVARKSGRTHIAREDVESHLNDGANLPPGQDANDGRFWDVDHSVYGPVTAEPLSRFARLAAENLSAANRAIPQVTHHDHADMRAVEAFRAGPLRSEALHADASRGCASCWSSPRFRQ